MTCQHALIVLVTMIFCHIVDDFYLQGILAQMKQRKWWYENAPEQMYQNDYKVALVIHAISWSFMIELPLLIYALIQNNELSLYVILGLYVLNTIIHTMIDNLKANAKIINLVQDQTGHLMQIVFTWIIVIRTIGR